MIVNLTQHQATPEQIAQGVVDLPDAFRQRLVELLTFESLPSSKDVGERVEAIVGLALGFWDSVKEERADTLLAMIGGAPFLMGPLSNGLSEWSVPALFAFSVRETEEQTQPDGSVRKVSVFRHAGFVK